MLNNSLTEKGLQLGAGVCMLDVKVSRADNMGHHNLSLFKLAHLELRNDDGADH